jgi:hypothetical protein
LNRRIFENPASPGDRLRRFQFPADAPTFHKVREFTPKNGGRQRDDESPESKKIVTKFLKIFFTSPACS